MTEKSDRGLLVGARPLSLAETACKRLVEGTRGVNGTLLLDANPTWAGATNTVLVESGVRVSECAARAVEQPFDVRHHRHGHRRFIRNSLPSGLWV